MALWREEQGEGTPWGFRVLQKTLGKYMVWGHKGGKEVGKPNTKWKLYKPKSHHPQCTPPLHPTPTCVVVVGAQLVFLKPFTIAQVGGVALSGELVGRGWWERGRNPLEVDFESLTIQQG